MESGCIYDEFAEHDMKSCQSTNSLEVLHIIIVRVIAD